MKKSLSTRRMRNRATIHNTAIATVQPLEARVLFAAFAAGDIVVYRTGDGVHPITGTSTTAPNTPVFLDEYTPAGVFVQSIPMPTTSAGTGTNLNQPLTGGAGGSEGLLSVSSDGSTLLVPGYDGEANTAAAGPHTIGIITASGGVNTSNTYTDFAASGTPRGVSSPDGSTLYFSGSTGGLRSAVANGTQNQTSTNASSSTSTTNLRGVEVINGTVYVSTSSGSIFRIGTLSGSTITSLPGLSGSVPNGPYAFFFASNVSLDDTLYVADDGTNTLDKFSLVSGSWTAEGTITDTNITGITGIQNSPTSVTLFMTGVPSTTTATSTLSSFTDTLNLTSATSITAGALTNLLTLQGTATSDEALHGVSGVPQAPTLPSVTTQPQNVPAIAGGNATFTAFATGTPAPTVLWKVDKGDGNGFVPVTNALINTGANFTTLVVPVSSPENGFIYKAFFTNGSGTVASNPATLTVSTAPQLTFDAATYTVNEGTNGTSISVKVDRLGDTSQSDAVTVTTHDGTALAGTNYTTAITGTNYNAGTGVLTFPAGDSSETISIPILSAHPQNGNKAFTVTLSSPTGTGSTLGGTTTTAITITDNLETFSLSSAAYTVDETSGFAFISVNRTGVLDPATLSYSTVAGSALDGTNYTGTGGAASGTVTFAANQVVGVLKIPIIDVNPQGGNKNFTVNLSLSGAGTNLGGDFGQLGSTASATETIIDAAPLTAPTLLAGAPNSVSNIETSGPFASNFTIIVGDTTTTTTTTNLSFLNYAVLEFTKANSPSLYPNTGFTVNSLSNLSLSIFTPSDLTYHPLISGNFNMYFIPDPDASGAGGTLTTGLTFNSALSTGLDPSQFHSAPQLMGTFSFQGGIAGAANTGVSDTYTPNPATTATVSSEIVAALNAGSSFRLALTPTNSGVGAIATRLGGVGGAAAQVPSLSLSVNQTQTASAETIALTSATYSVSEIAGTEEIDLTRTGASQDTATVTYTLTDGNAIEGTNYGTAGTSSPPITGTVTFLQGATTAKFFVPIINAPNQGGNKALTITLSNPSSDSNPAPTTVAVLGQSTAILTIQDSSSAPVEPLNNYAARLAQVETADVFAASFNLSNSTASFPAYTVADFNDPAVNGPNGGTNFTPSNPITAINDITLTIFNVGGGASGMIDVYLVPDATSSIAVNSTQHTYDISKPPEGLDSSGSNSFGTPMLLGKIKWDANTPAGTIVSFPLINYNAATENALISDLNLPGAIFRIVATPEDNSVVANWGTSTTTILNGNPEDPQLSLDVQEGVVNPAPAWISPADILGTNYTWNAATNALNVLTTVDIIADPGTGVDPIITTSSGATIFADVPDTGATVQPIHIGGLTLTNASMTINSVGGHTATHHDVLVVASGGAFSLDATSKLNLTDNDALFVSGSSSTVTTKLKTGFGGTGAYWNGAGGIVSSAAAGNTQFLTTLGVGSGGATFDSITTTSSDVLVKYTYYGDADLSGKVDGADYQQIDLGFGTSASTWSKGDFNYDGVVNGSDFALIDNTFNQTLATNAAPLAIVASVPASSPAVARPAAMSVFSSTAITSTDDAGKDKKSLAQEVLD